MLVKVAYFKIRENHYMSDVCDYEISFQSQQLWKSSQSDKLYSKVWKWTVVSFRCFGNVRHSSKLNLPEIEFCLAGSLKWSSIQKMSQKIQAIPYKIEVGLVPNTSPSGTICIRLYPLNPGCPTSCFWATMDHF